MIAYLRQRLADWLRERRISALMTACVGLRGLEAYKAFTAMRDEVKSRSPGQVERMEKARGLR